MTTNILVTTFYIIAAMVLKVHGDENMGEQKHIEDVDLGYNKTDIEIMLEYCMGEYSQCVSIDRKLPMCAENNSKVKKQFESLCDMEYENCRRNNKESNWHYLKDESC